MLTFWPVPGGCKLPANKEISSLHPPSVAKLPRRLVYPLPVKHGDHAVLAVTPGERVLKGQVLLASSDKLSPPIHAASSGRVVGIEQWLLPVPSGYMGSCVVVATDGLDEPISQQGLADYRVAKPQELLEKIQQAGIVGMGGAGFPAAVKLNPSHAHFLDTLIINGAECEPYISCDDALMRHDPHSILTGANILLHILGIHRCLLAVEDDKPQAIAALEHAQAEGDYAHIRIVPIPAIYPSGGEKQLILRLTGREVPYQGIPADIGVICQNVATVAAVRYTISTGEALLSRIVTVTGAGVATPQNLWVRIGTPVAELIQQCGGYTDTFEGLLMGGPMMGFALNNDPVPVTATTNCLLVAGQGELISSSRQEPLPCIRCGACATVCPMNLLPQQLHWHLQASQLDRAWDYRLPDCIECGCCDVVCPSHIPLAQSFRLGKKHAQAREQDRQKADQARQRFAAKQARKAKADLAMSENTKRKKAMLAKILGQVDS